MTTTATAAGKDASGLRQGVVSKEARSVAGALLDMAPGPRRRVIANLDQRELSYVLLETQREMGAMYALWRDTPSGFVEDVLGETIWSKQKEIVDAIPHRKRIIVPAGFGVGKTHISARAVVWFCNVYPPGTAQAVTIAPRFRQVRNQLWPHIRKIVKRADLPGHADTVQYKIPDANGVDTIVAYGFSAPENDESAMQGVHATRLLLVVEEAGGLPKAVGEGTNNLLTGDARMFAIGNPAMDDPGSWFETMSEEGWAGHHPGTVTIPIATVDSPAITGELTPICMDCKPNVDNHRIADVHMPDQEWVDRTREAYGEDHPYYIAKVLARFPKDAGVRIIPTTWVEAAADTPEPEGPGYRSLESLGLPDETRTFDGHDHIVVPAETDPYLVKDGAWVRLGIDVAAGGGDEFAIYRAVGDMVHHRHTSAGAQNNNAVTVAEVALGHIIAAERLAKAIGSKGRVHVKVDTIGVGWGVVGLLQRWGQSGPGQRHTAVIVPVNVAENPENSDEGAAMRPYRKRDELWLSGRMLMQPDPEGRTKIRLRVDAKTKAQFAVPSYTNNSGGFIVVESKDSMKKRGRNSPDRAEAALLATYEPAVTTRKNRGILNGGR